MARRFREPQKGQGGWNGVSEEGRKRRECQRDGGVGCAGPGGPFWWDSWHH